jgi:hypothetical protein
MFSPRTKHAAERLSAGKSRRIEIATHPDLTKRAFIIILKNQQTWQLQRSLEAPVWW